jgi:hypothetical protein
VGCSAVGGTRRASRAARLQHPERRGTNRHPRVAWQIAQLLKCGVQRGAGVGEECRADRLPSTPAQQQCGPGAAQPRRRSFSGRATARPAAPSRLAALRCASSDAKGSLRTRSTILASTAHLRMRQPSGEWSSTWRACPASAAASASTITGSWSSCANRTAWRATVAAARRSAPGAAWSTAAANAASSPPK